jgi:hypothetical protein
MHLRLAMYASHELSSSSGPALCRHTSQEALSVIGNACIDQDIVMLGLHHAD